MEKKEEENPWDFDPFAGGPAPFSKKKKKKPATSDSQQGEPEVFHLEPVEDSPPAASEDYSAAAEAPPPPPTVTKPKETPPPPADDDFPHAIVPDDPDEAVNPYAAPPPKSQTKTPAAPKNKTVISTLPEYRPPSKLLRAKERLLDAIPPLPITIGIGAVILLVLVVIALRPLFQKSALDNLPPVAVLTPPDSLQIQENDRLVLDASDSHDPEGESISFEWRLIAEEGIEVIFSEMNDSRRRRTARYLTSTPQVRVHFIDPGEVTIALRVNDGLVFSEPVDVTFEVAPLNTQ